MSPENRPKVSLTVAAAAVAASILLAWVGYKSGELSLAGPRAALIGAQRRDYLQGSIEGSFLVPCLISLFALIPKGRSTRRTLIVYSVSAAIVSLVVITTFR